MADGRVADGKVRAPKKKFPFGATLFFFCLTVCIRWTATSLNSRASEVKIFNCNSVSLQKGPSLEWLSRPFGFLAAFQINVEDLTGSQD